MYPERNIVCRSIGKQCQIIGTRPPYKKEVSIAVTDGLIGSSDV